MRSCFFQDHCEILFTISLRKHATKFLESKIPAWFPPMSWKKDF